MLFTNFTDLERKQFISEVIDLCLYNSEGFDKLVFLINEEKKKGLSRRIDVDNTHWEDDSHDIVAH
jgi:hypothetical protein